MTSPELENSSEWRELVAAMTGGAMSPRLFTGDPPPRPGHGRFASHTDLPILEPDEAARMGPVWDAIYELVRQHPSGCGCDPGAMAWRATYATAEILLRLPDAEGVFRKRYVGDTDDGYVYGWRCSKHPATIERLSKGWGGNSARSAYEAHMMAKHPQEGDDDD